MCPEEAVEPQRDETTSRPPGGHGLNYPAQDTGQSGEGRTLTLTTSLLFDSLVESQSHRLKKTQSYEEGR